MKNYKFYFAILILTLVVGTFLILFYYNYTDNTDEIIINGNKDNNAQIEKDEELTKEEIIDEDVYYYVDIKGAVNNPNVYKIKENSRVIDVINMAGGLKEEADTSIINLSKKVTDEMFIVIYTKDEIQKYKEQTISTEEIKKKIEEDVVIVDKNNDAQIPYENSDSLVNINTASKEELLTISGIGDSKADSIIKYREENGDFKVIDDIKNISGIGDTLFEEIKDFITV